MPAAPPQERFPLRRLCRFKEMKKKTFRQTPDGTAPPLGQGLRSSAKLFFKREALSPKTQKRPPHQGGCRANANAVTERFFLKITKDKIMAEQLWKGRFSKAVDSRVNDFNSSIRFDQRMIAQDMRGSGVGTPRCWPNRASSPRKTVRISSTVWLPSPTIWLPASWRSTPVPRMCTPLWSRP